MSHFNVILPVPKDLFSEQENKAIDALDICKLQHTANMNHYSLKILKQIESVIEKEADELLAPYSEDINGNDNVDDVDATDRYLDYYFDEPENYRQSNSFLGYVKSCGAEVYHEAYRDHYETKDVELKACILDGELSKENAEQLEKELHRPMRPGETKEGYCAFIRKSLEILQLEPVNPKWDYWEIGGRWKNSMPFTGKTDNKEKTVTWCRVKDLGKSYSRKENGKMKTFRFYPFAAIDKYGEWYEQGFVGWFGSSDATDDSINQFCEDFDRILQDLDPDDLVVSVDCHI